jgi:hypothetical protein
MQRKSASSSAYQRVAAAWREMRKRIRPGQRDPSLRGVENKPDYVIEDSPEDRIGIYRAYRPATGRDEMSRRMEELTELMLRHYYTGGLIDMRKCRFDERPAANDLSQEAVLPYAVNPLWRLALLVSADETSNAPPAMFDALLKLHRRAGVQMQKFEEYEGAVRWLQRARDDLLTKL